MVKLTVQSADLVGIRADNPSPLTLSGTNSWIVGRDPAWLVDPGPSLPEHLQALADEIEHRGGLGGVALTPVPGGVGPVTTALLLRHVVAAAAAG